MKAVEVILHLGEFERMQNKKKFYMRAFALAIVLSLLQQIAPEAAADEGFCSAESAETKSDCEGDDLQTYSQSQVSKWCKTEQVRQCLGFCTAHSQINQDKNQLYKYPNMS